MKEIKGSDVARQMKEQMTVQIEELKGYIPHLAIIRVGERPDDISYEKGATKRAQRLGLRCTSFCFLLKSVMTSLWRSSRKSTGIRMWTESSC